MEEEETRILSALGWKGKGLISASSPEIDLPVNTINNISVEALSTSGKGGKLFSLFAWSNTLANPNQCPVRRSKNAFWFVECSLPSSTLACTLRKEKCRLAKCQWVAGASPMWMNLGKVVSPAWLISHQDSEPKIIKDQGQEGVDHYETETNQVWQRSQETNGSNSLKAVSHSLFLEPINEIIPP